MSEVQDPSPRRFHYDAQVSFGALSSIHDGDTCTVDIDLGHGVWLRKQPLRLYGLNAPEITGPQKEDGKKSRDALARLLGFSIGGAPGLPVSTASLVIETLLDKDEKYGRVLAKIYTKTPAGRWICVNDEMIRTGFAKTWDGQGSKPV